MIQRVQSIFLSLVAIAMFSFFFTAIASINVANNSYNYSIFCLNKQGGENLNFAMYPTFLIGLCSTIFIVAVYCIFVYKSRIKQLKFVRLNTLLILILIIVLLLGINHAYTLIAQETNKAATTTHYLFGSILPFIALVLNILAFRAIKKDEALVRSADRIR